MRIRIVAVGRMRDGPERALTSDYIARLAKAGPGAGFRSIEEVEVDAGGGRDKEGARVLQRLGGARAVRLDEHGEQWTSADLSQRLVRWRDAGEDVDFLIGGADGHGAEIAGRAPQAVAFGVQTWPHRLVRAMLAEQLYRAVSIATGGPYHRE